MGRYELTSTYTGNKIDRVPSGTIMVDGKEEPFTDPFMPEVDELTSIHDELHESNPKRRVITTIVEEE